MNGRFPLDVFTIIVVPFIAIGVGVFLPALLTPAHGDHRLAVTVAVTIAVVILLSAIVVGIRRWRRRHPGQTVS